MCAETNEEPSTSPPASAGGKSSSQQSHKRPKWAMTQGEAGQAEAREEDQEAQVRGDTPLVLQLAKHHMPAAVSCYLPSALLCSHHAVLLVVGAWV